MKADLSLLDLSGVSFCWPLNSAARQIVFSESGANVHTVIVGGRVVLENRRLTLVDEEELRAAVEVVIGPLRDDAAQVRARFEDDIALHTGGLAPSLERGTSACIVILGPGRTRDRVE